MLTSASDKFSKGAVRRTTESTGSSATCQAHMAWDNATFQRKMNRFKQACFNPKTKGSTGKNRNNSTTPASHKASTMMKNIETSPKPVLAASSDRHNVLQSTRGPPVVPKKSNFQNEEIRELRSQLQQNINKRRSFSKILSLSRKEGTICRPRELDTTTGQSVKTVGDCEALQRTDNTTLEQSQSERENNSPSSYDRIRQVELEITRMQEYLQATARDVEGDNIDEEEEDVDEDGESTHTSHQYDGDSVKNQSDEYENHCENSARGVYRQSCKITKGKDWRNDYTLRKKGRVYEEETPPENWGSGARPNEKITGTRHKRSDPTTSIDNDWRTVKAKSLTTNFSFELTDMECYGFRESPVPSNEEDDHESSRNYEDSEEEDNTDESTCKIDSYVELPEGDKMDVKTITRISAQKDSENGQVRTHAGKDATDAASDHSSRETATASSQSQASPVSGASNTGQKRREVNSLNARCHFELRDMECYGATPSSVTPVFTDRGDDIDQDGSAPGDNILAVGDDNVGSNTAEPKSKAVSTEEYEEGFGEYSNNQVIEGDGIEFKFVEVKKNENSRHAESSKSSVDYKTHEFLNTVDMTEPRDKECYESDLCEMSQVGTDQDNDNREDAEANETLSNTGSKSMLHKEDVVADTDDSAKRIPTSSASVQDVEAEKDADDSDKDSHGAGHVSSSVSDHEKLTHVGAGMECVSGRNETSLSQEYAKDGPFPEDCVRRPCPNVRSMPDAENKAYHLPKKPKAPIKERELLNGEFSVMNYCVPLEKLPLSICGLEETNKARADINDNTILWQDNRKTDNSRCGVHVSQLAYQSSKIVSPYCKRLIKLQPGLHSVQENEFGPYEDLSTAGDAKSVSYDRQIHQQAPSSGTKVTPEIVGNSGDIHQRNIDLHLCGATDSGEGHINDIKVSAEMPDINYVYSLTTAEDATDGRKTPSGESSEEITISPIKGSCKFITREDFSENHSLFHDVELNNKRKRSEDCVQQNGYANPRSLNQWREKSVTNETVGKEDTINPCINRAERVTDETHPVTGVVMTSVNCEDTCLGPDMAVCCGDESRWVTLSETCRDQTQTTFRKTPESVVILPGPTVSANVQQLEGVHSGIKEDQSAEVPTDSGLTHTHTGRQEHTVTSESVGLKSSQLGLNQTDGETEHTRSRGSMEREFDLSKDYQTVASSAAKSVLGEFVLPELQWKQNVNIYNPHPTQPCQHTVVPSPSILDGSGQRFSDRHSASAPFYTRSWHQNASSACQKVYETTKDSASSCSHIVSKTVESDTAYQKSIILTENHPFKGDYSTDSYQHTNSAHSSVSDISEGKTAVKITNPDNHVHGYNIKENNQCSENHSLENCVPIHDSEQDKCLTSMKEYISSKMGALEDPQQKSYTTEAHHHALISPVNYRPERAHGKSSDSSEENTLGSSGEHVGPCYEAENIPHRPPSKSLQCHSDEPTQRPNTLGNNAATHLENVQLSSGNYCSTEVKSSRISRRNTAERNSADNLAHSVFKTEQNGVPFQIESSQLRDMGETDPSTCLNPIMNNVENAAPIHAEDTRRFSFTETSESQTLAQELKNAEDSFPFHAEDTQFRVSGTSKPETAERTQETKRDVDSSTSDSSSLLPEVTSVELCANNDQRFAKGQNVEDELEIINRKLSQEENFDANNELIPSNTRFPSQISTVNEFADERHASSPCSGKGETGKVCSNSQRPPSRTADLVKMDPRECTFSVDGDLAYQKCEDAQGYSEMYLATYRSRLSASKASYYSHSPIGGNCPSRVTSEESDTEIIFSQKEEEPRLTPPYYMGSESQVVYTGLKQGVLAGDRKDPAKYINDYQGEILGSCHKSMNGVPDVQTEVNVSDIIAMDQKVCRQMMTNVLSRARDQRKDLRKEGGKQDPKTAKTSNAKAKGEDGTELLLDCLVTGSKMTVTNRPLAKAKPYKTRVNPPSLHSKKKKTTAHDGFDKDGKDCKMKAQGVAKRLPNVTKSLRQQPSSNDRCCEKRPSRQSISSNDAVTKTHNAKLACAPDEKLTCQTSRLLPGLETAPVSKTSRVSHTLDFSDSVQDQTKRRAKPIRTTENLRASQHQVKNFHEQSPKASANREPAVTKGGAMGVEDRPRAQSDIQSPRTTESGSKSAENCQSKDDWRPGLSVKMKENISTHKRKSHEHRATNCVHHAGINHDKQLAQRGGNESELEKNRSNEYIEAEGRTKANSPELVLKRNEEITEALLEKAPSDEDPGTECDECETDEICSEFKTPHKICQRPVSPVHEFQSPGNKEKMPSGANGAAQTFADEGTVPEEHDVVSVENISELEEDNEGERDNEFERDNELEFGKGNAQPVRTATEMSQKYRPANVDEECGVIEAADTGNTNCEEEEDPKDALEGVSKSDENGKIRPKSTASICSQDQTDTTEHGGNARRTNIPTEGKGKCRNAQSSLISTIDYLLKYQRCDVESDTSELEDAGYETLLDSSDLRQDLRFSSPEMETDLGQVLEADRKHELATLSPAGGQVREEAARDTSFGEAVVDAQERIQGNGFAYDGLRHDNLIFLCKESSINENIGVKDEYVNSEICEKIELTSDAEPVTNKTHKATSENVKESDDDYSSTMILPSTEDAMFDKNHAEVMKRMHCEREEKDSCKTAKETSLTNPDMSRCDNAETRPVRNGYVNMQMLRTRGRDYLKENKEQSYSVLKTKALDKARSALAKVKARQTAIIDKLIDSEEEDVPALFSRGKGVKSTLTEQNELCQLSNNVFRRDSMRKHGQTRPPSIRPENNIRELKIRKKLSVGDDFPGREIPRLHTEENFNNSKSASDEEDSCGPPVNESQSSSREPRSTSHNIDKIRCWSSSCDWSGPKINGAPAATKVVQKSRIPVRKTPQNVQSSLRTHEDANFSVIKCKSTPRTIVIVLKNEKGEPIGERVTTLPAGTSLAREATIVTRVDTAHTAARHTEMIIKVLAASSSSSSTESAPALDRRGESGGPAANPGRTSLADRLKKYMIARPRNIHAGKRSEKGVPMRTSFDRLTPATWKRAEKAATLEISDSNDSHVPLEAHAQVGKTTANMTESGKNVSAKVKMTTGSGKDGLSNIPVPIKGPSHLMSSQKKHNPQWNKLLHKRQSIDKAPLRPVLTNEPAGSLEEHSKSSEYLKENSFLNKPPYVEGGPANCPRGRSLSISAKIDTGLRHHSSVASSSQLRRPAETGDNGACAAAHLSKQASCKDGTISCDTSANCKRQTNLKRLERPAPINQGAPDLGYELLSKCELLSPLSSEDSGKKFQGEVDGIVSHTHFDIHGADHPLQEAQNNVNPVSPSESASCISPINVATEASIGNCWEAITSRHSSDGNRENDSASPYFKAHVVGGSKNDTDMSDSQRNSSIDTADREDRGDKEGKHGDYRILTDTANSSVCVQYRNRVEETPSSAENVEHSRPSSEQEQASVKIKDHEPSEAHYSSTNSPSKGSGSKSASHSTPLQAKFDQNYLKKACSPNCDANLAGLNHGGHTPFLTLTDTPDSNSSASPQHKFLRLIHEKVHMQSKTSGHCGGDPVLTSEAQGDFQVEHSPGEDLDCGHDQNEQQPESTVDPKAEDELLSLSSEITTEGTSRTERQMHRGSEEPALLTKNKQLLSPMPTTYSPTTSRKPSKNKGLLFDKLCISSVESSTTPELKPSSHESLSQEARMISLTSSGRPRSHLSNTQAWSGTTATKLTVKPVDICPLPEKRTSARSSLRKRSDSEMAKDKDTPIYTSSDANIQITQAEGESLKTPEAVTYSSPEDVFNNWQEKMKKCVSTPAHGRVNHENDTDGGSPSPGEVTTLAPYKGGGDKSRSHGHDSSQTKSSNEVSKNVKALRKGNLTMIFPEIAVSNVEKEDSIFFTECQSFSYNSEDESAIRSSQGFVNNRCARRGDGESSSPAVISEQLETRNSFDSVKNLQTESSFCNPDMAHLPPLSTRQVGLPHKPKFSRYY